MKPERVRVGTRIRIKQPEHPFYGRTGAVTVVTTQMVWVAIDGFKGGGSYYKIERGLNERIEGNTATIPFAYDEFGDACAIAALGELLDDEEAA